MSYQVEYVICLNDNFEDKYTKDTPKFGEIYSVEVDMNSLLQIEGFGESLFPQENFSDITEAYFELVDILISNNIDYDSNS